MEIGVLALQGGVAEHCEMLKRCDVCVKEVRIPEDIETIDGLVIPGGESTTIGKLVKRIGLDESIKKKYKKGMPVFGTCAGAILLSKNIINSNQFRLGLADIIVKRNNYGRQADSFEADIEIPVLGDRAFRAVFIRAPVFSVKMGDVLASFAGDPVLLKQKNILISSFHPELSGDTRLHEYFISMVKKEGHDRPKE